VTGDLLVAAAAANPAAGSPLAVTDELLSRPLALVVALAVVGLLPFLFMTLTSFAKIATVLYIARAGIGAPEVPSGAVVIALSAALTLLAMAPVATRISDRMLPLLEPTAAAASDHLVRDVVSAVGEPLRGFLRANATTRHTDRFYELLRNAHPPADRQAIRKDDLRVVIPAFLVTELMEAFALGFAILLPFLVIDFVVASVLAGLGMTALSPTQVSLPFKLLLFVAADGWSRLAEALVTGYLPG